jgi:hypothetical protein
MSGIATAIIGSAVVGGYAAKKAASKQAEAANNATAAQQTQVEQVRNDNAPWMKEGGIAIGMMGQGIQPGGEFTKTFGADDFEKDPGYQFRMDEGMRGVENSGSARGGVLGGRTLKELMRYGQGFASNEYGNAYNRFNNDLTTKWNRLASVAGAGQTATRDVGVSGTNGVNQINENTVGAGNARASGYIGVGNAITGGAQSLGNFYQNQRMMQQMQQMQPSYTGRSAYPEMDSGSYGSQYDYIGGGP